MNGQLEASAALTPRRLLCSLDSLYGRGGEEEIYTPTRNRTTVTTSP